MAYRILPGFSSGRTDIPPVQRDALIDAGTIGLFDFGHGWGYPAMTSPVAAAAPFKNYVRGKADIANDGTAKTWTGGRLAFTQRLVSSAVPLPLDWRLPTSTTHFALGFFARFPTTGPALGSGTLDSEVVGCWGNAGRQYALFLKFDGSNGNFVSAHMTMNGSAFNVTAGFPTDGLSHHFAMEYTLLTPTTWNARLYVDGVLTYTSVTVTGASGLLVDGGANVPAIGTFYVTNTNSYTSAIFSIGRIWLQDLAVAGSKTLAAMIAQDRAAHSARFAN